MCSYCGCRNIPLIARLTRQHEEITNHTTALRAAARNDDRSGAAAAVEALGLLMHPHTHLEERGLFAEMRKDDLFTEHIDSLCAEHKELDKLSEAVAAGDLSRIGPLLTLLANCIDREENGVFPAALAALDDEQWDRLQGPGMLDGTATAAHPDALAHGVPHRH